MKRNAASKRKINEAANKSERRRWKRIKGIAPARDRVYREWIASLLCVACEANPFRRTRGIQLTETQCAHVGPTRGIGQKCSDYETIPLCRYHHERGYKFSHHTLGKRFWAHHGIDRDAIIAALNQAYAERKEAA